VIDLTLVRLGFVAMSMELDNASPSQTMTYKTFQGIDDREAAIHRLERIANSNLQHSLRILKHCAASEVEFYRFSSRLVPLATHDALHEWDYLPSIKNSLKEVGKFVQEKGIRVDFHPDHFVLINSPKKEVFIMSMKTLEMHYKLIRGMGLLHKNRCVMHVGGNYKDAEAALERFVTNWMIVPRHIQEMIMLENDDTSFTLLETLYLCEKLEIPLVFDLHHHLAFHQEKDWLSNWDRIVRTWEHENFPIKMHISSPKNEKQFRHHADYIDPDMFVGFLHDIKESVPQIDCMIEAKQKDKALFKLVEDLKQYPEITFETKASFTIK
jgi:UV DNA damage endonuclease